MDNTGQEQAGMAWTEIAEEGYKAYAAHSGNVNFQGNPMPTWENLPPAIREHWEAAVRHVGNLCRDGRIIVPAEYWKEWNPPV